MNYIGIDVAKAKIDVLWLKDLDHLKVKTKVLNNDPNGFEQLHQWLKKCVSMESHQIHVIVEATGIYHEELSYFLHDLGYVVSVINPSYTRKFAEGLGIQHKTDKKDSLVLARYGFMVRPAVWHPEPASVRKLKALIARVDALEAELRREENRLEKANIANNTPEEVMASIHSNVLFLKASIKKLEQDIKDHIDGHPKLKHDKALLESIPGVGEKVSRSMLALIHSRLFKNSAQLTAFLGLIPVQQESGTFKGRSKLSKKGSSQIRALLYFPAIVATKWNHNIKAQYVRLLKAGKSKMQAIGAAMRKLVQLCFGVLKTQKCYDPSYKAA